MFSTKTFVALLVFVAPFLVRADVMPTGPSPGAVYNEGSSCPITWKGDTDSNTIWKNMAIQLMSGSNLNMVPVTTVATGQDGTVAGQFNYTCPSVNPNSNIYFYQFTAPATSNVTWTGRFTIASPAGLTTPPANANQPDGSKIPWGNGALVDSSTVVPPPTFAPNVSMSSSIASNSSTLAVVTSSTATTGSATPALTSVVTGASPVISISSSPIAQSTSGAMTTFDIRVWGAAAAATLALSLIW